MVRKYKGSYARDGLLAKLAIVAAVIYTWRRTGV